MFWPTHAGGKNGRHALAGLFRQSGRLAGYEDVNDAERLRHDPAMRWIVGGKAAQRSAASPSQMGRFETQWLAAPKNFAALARLAQDEEPGLCGGDARNGRRLGAQREPQSTQGLPQQCLKPSNYLVGSPAF